MPSTRLDSLLGEQILSPTPSGSSQPETKEADYEALFQEAGQRHGVDPKILKALAMWEHRGRLGPRSARAVSPPNRNGTRDYGVMQVNDSTAKSLGVEPETLFDPATNIDTAARLLSLMRDELGDEFTMDKWLASYNAGTGAIKQRGIFNQAYVRGAKRYLEGEPQITAPSRSTRLDALLGESTAPTPVAPSTPSTSPRLDALLGSGPARQQVAQQEDEMAIADVGKMVVEEGAKFIKDTARFVQEVAQNPGAWAFPPSATAKMTFEDEEDVASAARGAVNVGSMVAPFGAAARGLARPISNVLARRILQAEIHSIASLAAWNAGQAAVEGEDVGQAAMEGAAMGAIVPPVAKVGGKGAGLLVKGAAQATGFGLKKGVAPVLKAADRLALKADSNEVYKSTRDALIHFYDRVLIPGSHLLRKAGMTETAELIERARVQQHLLAGKWQAMLESTGAGLRPSIFSSPKLSKTRAAMRQMWGRMLDSSDEEAARLAATVPYGKDLLSRRAVLKAVHSEIADMAEAAGVLQVDAKSGKLRHFIRREDWGIPRVYVNIEKMLQPGKLQDQAIKAMQEQYPRMSRARALRILEGLHKRQQAALEQGNWEGMGYANLQGRSYNLPGYETDPFKVLPNYYARMAREIANHTAFGTGGGTPGEAATGVWKMADRFPGAFALLKNVADPARRRVAQRVIERQLGGVERDLTADKVAKVARVQAVMKLGLAQIAQLSQFGQAFTQTGFRNGFRDILELATTRPEDHIRLLKTGAFHESLARQAHMELMGGESQWVSKTLQKTGFTMMDTAARRLGALRGFSMAQHQAEDLAELLARRDVAKGLEKRYIENKIASIEKKFLSLDIDPAKIIQQGGTLEEDDLLRAGQRISTDVNFWGDSLSLPEYFRSPWGRIFTQFKSFSYQQSAFLKKAVIDPAVKDGDLGPLARLLLTQSVVGEGIVDLRSLAALKQRDKEGFARLVDNLSYAAVFGIVADGLRATSDIGRVASFLLGPTASDVVTVIEGTAEAAKGRPRKLGKKAIQTAPVFMGPLAPLGSVLSPAISNIVFPPREQ